MNWTAYLMGFARHAATKSKDPTRVGAVLVGPGNEVRLTAFNGPPAGVEDSPDRFERPRKYLFASHAEANLIAFAAKVGMLTEGCVVYTTHAPCASCARTLIQAGIARVVYGSGKTSMPPEEFEAAATMFREAHLTCEPCDESAPVEQAVGLAVRDVDLGEMTVPLDRQLAFHIERGDRLAADLAITVLRADRAEKQLAHTQAQMKIFSNRAGVAEWRLRKVVQALEAS